MAGLAGLSLASRSRFFPGFFKHHPVTTLLTDGHPSAVFNNRVSAALTCSVPNVPGQPTRQRNVTAEKLLWKEGAAGAAECAALTRGAMDDGFNMFQLCIVCDCVHFQESHAALVATMARLVSAGGQCVLIQPDRADSAANFLAMIERVNGAGGGEEKLFEAEVVERFDEAVWRAHLLNLERADMKDVYKPNIHLPKAIILTKGRDFREEEDGLVLAEVRREQESKRERAREERKAAAKAQN